MSKHSYYTFFHQQQKRSTQRRARKPLDLQALFGERREPVLTFFQPGKDRETEEDHQYQPTVSVVHRLLVLSVQVARHQLVPLDANHRSSCRRMVDHSGISKVKGSDGGSAVVQSSCERQYCAEPCLSDQHSLPQQTPLRSPRFPQHDIDSASLRYYFTWIADLCLDGRVLAQTPCLKADHSSLGFILWFRCLHEPLAPKQRRGNIPTC